MSSEAWKSLFDVIALVLLFLTAVAGVGVLIFGNKVNKEQATRLRQFDSDLTKAKSDLATQQERAAKADAAVAGLQKGVASAETEMAKQQTKAATAELALLELQQRLKHRRISAEDHKKMVLALQPFHGSVVELTKLKEPEAEQFADDLISVFSEAK
jgi:septal ring factor EnvC (AmiA/AmiB activator)